MSATNHPWCRDVQRDEAIRAAEDAAAAERTPLPDHRDLPAAVAELRERVARIEGHCRIEATKQARLWAAVIPKSVSGSSAEAHENKGDTMQPGWIRAFYRENELAAERDAARAEAQRLSMANRTLVGVADALEARVSELKAAAKLDRDAARAEAERLRRPATWQEEEAAVEAAWSLCGLEPDWPSDEPGTIVRHAESMRREIGRLRDRVAELESAPAANAGGVARQEPVAWGVRTKSGRWWNTCFDRRDRMESCVQGADAEHAVVSPLYAAPVAEESATTPPPPRGWLTRHERWRLGEMVAWLKGRAAEHPDTIHGGLCESYAADIDALLARETPPRVRRPNVNVVTLTAGARDRMWIAAIREAGGEVEG